jgi:hypothetical protein
MVFHFVFGFQPEYELRNMKDFPDSVMRINADGRPFRLIIYFQLTTFRHEAFPKCFEVEFNGNSKLIACARSRHR